MYKSSKFMYFAPSNKNAASVPTVTVSAPAPPLKVIVFVAEEPLISPKAEDIENDPA